MEKREKQEHVDFNNFLREYSETRYETVLNFNFLLFNARYFLVDVYRCRCAQHVLVYAIRHVHIWSMMIESLHLMDEWMKSLTVINNNNYSFEMKWMHETWVFVWERNRDVKRWQKEEEIEMEMELGRETRWEKKRKSISFCPSISIETNLFRLINIYPILFFFFSFFLSLLIAGRLKVSSSWP